MTVSQKDPSRPQSHQHMSPLEQYLFDSARAGAPPLLSSIYLESIKSESHGHGGEEEVPVLEGEGEEEVPALEGEGDRRRPA